jgi:putative FmdB family regulatory protein
MPTYEYKCDTCGHQFEKFTTKISNKSSIECPKCDGLAQRLISGGAGFLFKGSGFYTTDYRKDSYKKEAKKESESGSGKETPKSDSSPTKPESKKDSKKDKK